MRLSIKTKLVLAIGAPLLAAYAVMLWCEYRLGKREALANMESHLTEFAARQAAELAGELLAAEELARTAAIGLASSPALAADQVHALLRENLRANPEVFGMGLAFEPGGFSPGVERFALYYCRDPRSGLRYVDMAAAIPDYANLAWYRPAKTGGRPLWTEPYFDAGVGERMMCTYTVPLFRQGGFRGVLTVDVLSDDLLDEMRRIKIGSGYCVLLSGQGKFISHPDPSLVMRETIFSLAERHGLDALAGAGVEMVGGKTGVRRIIDHRSGQPTWMVYAPVESAGWSLAALVPENEVMAPIYARLVRSLGVLVTGLAVIVGIVVCVSLRITRPIARLARAADLLAQGNLDARVTDVTGSDEIARLALRFNTMVAELKMSVDGHLREETARREIEGELKAARDIQASLLPRMLSPGDERGFVLHAVNTPAKLVAGDFFDFFFVDPGRLALAMADVSGKGVPAAMYMAVARTKLRDFAAPGKTPAEVVSEVNRSLAEENDQSMFLSLFLAYYDVTTGELTYVNAGHNPPYLVRANGRLESLEPTGPLVAPFPHAVFRDARCRLEQDDLLVLFTDGVTEAVADGNEMFGEERLERLLRASASDPVLQVCQKVIQAAGDFSQGDLADDATVLALRRTCRDECPAERPVAPACHDQPAEPSGVPA